MPRLGSGYRLSALVTVAAHWAIAGYIGLWLLGGAAVVVVWRALKAGIDAIDQLL